MPSLNASDKAGITIYGKGNYAGKRQTFFTILPKDINSLDIQVQDVKYVPGKELKGKVTVKGIGRFGGEKKLVFVLSK